MRSILSKAPLVAIVLAAFMALGCGSSHPDLAPVSGRVTLDGEPVFEAEVLFQPQEKRSPSTGTTDRDGRYELYYKRGVKGAAIGPHIVQIEMDTEIVDEDGKPKRRKQAIPARYNKQTELRREVKPGENVFDFDLKSESK
jgi:hypothetical protein